MKRSRAARLRRARLTVTFIFFRGSIRPSRTAFGSPGVTLRAARGFDRAGAALAVSTVDPPMAMATSKLTVRCLSLMPPPKIARHHTEIALPPQDLGLQKQQAEEAQRLDGGLEPRRRWRREFAAGRQRRRQ